MQKKHLKNYLEIGVFNGHIFFRIKSTFKLAVDPYFRFDTSRKIGKAVINPYNLFNQYFEKTSDDFFSQDAPKLFSGKKIDIALIDGMHEYNFVLRDIENTVRYMQDDAVIIIHDCNPQSREAAVSPEEWEARGGNDTWNGNVWKSIVHLRSLRSDLTSFVLDCDYGLGIVVKKKNQNPLGFSKTQIDSFSYEDLAANREKWLDLRPASFAYEFFGLDPVSSSR